MQNKSVERQARKLKGLFDYLLFTILPSITTYHIDRMTITKYENKYLVDFISDDILEYYWVYKRGSMIYAFVILKDMRYMYIRGHIMYDNTNFKFYTSSSYEDVLHCMSKSKYKKYLCETKPISAWYD
jgi:hypothetical protein